MPATVDRDVVPPRTPRVGGVAAPRARLTTVDAGLPYWSSASTCCEGVIALSVVMLGGYLSHPTYATGAATTLILAGIKVLGAVESAAVNVETPAIVGATALK